MKKNEVLACLLYGVEIARELRVRGIDKVPDFSKVDDCFLDGLTPAETVNLLIEFNWWQNPPKQQ